MANHDIKVEMSSFQRIIDGEIDFDIREKDTSLKAEDIVLMREWDGTNFTGRKAVREILYIVKDEPGLMPGYVIVGFG